MKLPIFKAFHKPDSYAEFASSNLPSISAFAAKTFVFACLEALYDLIDGAVDNDSEFEYSFTMSRGQPVFMVYVDGGEARSLSMAVTSTGRKALHYNRFNDECVRLGKHTSARFFKRRNNTLQSVSSAAA